MMNVLHIVYGSLQTGASRGVYTLHKGLRAYGVDSKILCTSENVHHSDHEFSYKNSFLDAELLALRSKLDKLPFRPFSPDEKSLFSSGFFGVPFMKHGLFREADIIHLHWINHGFIKTSDLKRVGKPIVWTVRDMWAMTGGCHVNYGCDRFKQGCGVCPQLSASMDHDITKVVMNHKLKHYPDNMVMVGITPWLAEQLSESSIFRNHDNRMIYNCIDTTEFSPVERETARNLLNLETEKSVICVGAQNLHATHKGFDLFCEALQHLDRDRYFLVLFGNADEKRIESCGLEYKNFGFIREEIALKLVYGSADLYVAPSLMESFGKTIAESMACGTPAVAFNATGQKSIIEHKKNGYLAKAFEPIDLARGIEWIAGAGDGYEDLSRLARQKVVETFDVSVIASQYTNLYDELL
jgi:glycosyltransferase involved in cell wall biosynthesis